MNFQFIDADRPCSSSMTVDTMQSTRRCSSSLKRPCERTSKQQQQKQQLPERRRTCVVLPLNACQSTDVILQQQQQQQQQQYQQNINLVRLHRSRLGQSEPHLRLSMKTSTVHRPKLAAFNLIHLKHALNKQSSCQQNSHSLLVSDSTVDVQTHDIDDFDRRWSTASGLSSSGYGTTSPLASPYASIERLQHQQAICTCQSSWERHCHDDSQRLESRSISMSLLDANLYEQDRMPLASIYRERYPKAQVQMEERLIQFIDTYKSIDTFDYCSDGSARFIHNQIVQLARDCLDRSMHHSMTTFYFNEMTENLERLVINSQDKCPQVVFDLQNLVKKLLFIIARSARLLECLQFDPEDFLRTLDQVEDQAKQFVDIKQDIPKYICSKLNLERNPMELIDDLLRVRTCRLFN
jgi:hypothetical protein